MKIIWKKKQIVNKTINKIWIFKVGHGHSIPKSVQFVKRTVQKQPIHMARNGKKREEEKKYYKFINFIILTPIRKILCNCNSQLNIHCTWPTPTHNLRENLDIIFNILITCFWNVCDWRNLIYFEQIIRKYSNNSNPTKIGFRNSCKEKSLRKLAQSQLPQ